MKKSFLCASFVLMAAALWADPASEIAKAGDAEWNAMVAKYQDSSTWVDLAPTERVVRDIEFYENKIMPFPEIDFGDFVTDKNGNKYYWYGEKGKFSFYVIKYDQRIQDLLYKLNNALGSASGEYEVLGRIVDAWSWWGDVVQMEVVAMRVKGRACVVMGTGEPVLVGQDILDKWLAGKAATWTAGIPGDAKAAPPGLSPEDVAKWFLFYGSTKKNDAVWVQLCSVEENAVAKNGALQAKGQSWWRMISKADREYYFVRAAPEKDTANKKTFMYQIKINGADAGVAKPMTVVQEKNGEWRVASF